MKKIVYKTETGIAVIHPAETIEECMKDIPAGAEYKIVEESEIPTDRTFRNAWGYDLKEDIPKSKEIWKNKLRVDRNPLFTENDIVLRDAVIENDDAKKDKGIIERDRLRNITKLVDSANTIEEIKAIAV